MSVRSSSTDICAPWKTSVRGDAADSRTHALASRAEWSVRAASLASTMPQEKAARPAASMAGGSDPLRRTPRAGRPADVRRPSPVLSSTVALPGLQPNPPRRHGSASEAAPVAVASTVPPDPAREVLTAPIPPRSRRYVEPGCAPTAAARDRPSNRSPRGTIRLPVVAPSGLVGPAPGHARGLGVGDVHAVRAQPDGQDGRRVVAQLRARSTEQVVVHGALHEPSRRNRWLVHHRRRAERPAGAVIPRAEAQPCVSEGPDRARSDTARRTR
ncbi:MAG: hypothetical protein JWO98_5163 [Frankiales bacterium]|nr:hypothetical protein [Frankiales bacterium]